ncbi:MAG: tandem-95 repeat protein [Acidimicrobiia bacterium]|nr:tandem-95 repeat protein [Acidimicrobiia bacterium]
MANVEGLKRTLLLAGLMLVVAFGVLSSQQAEAAEQGADTVGLVNPASSEWHLQLADGSSNSFYFGVPGDIPVVGDWNCDGVSTPGMWRQSDGFAYLRNSNSMGAADIQFTFGAPGDIPIAGDFDGDGCDTLGVYRSGRVFIANELGANNGFFAADYDFFFGNPGDKPFVGDFDGDGFDSIGLRRESSGFVYFTNSTGTNLIAPTDASFFFGQGGDKVVSGDWTFSGFDTVGIWRATDESFYLNYLNELAVADEIVQFGSASWIPVTGKFSGTPVFPPLALDDVIELAEGGVVEGDVAVNDVSNVPVSPNELPSTLDVTLVTGPSYGILELGDDGLFTYTHDGSENHTDSFTYRVTDSNGLTADGAVTINIAPSNDNAPQVSDMSVSVDEGQTLEIAPNDGLLSTTSDLDVPPDVLAAELVIPTSFGTVSVNEDGSFVYTHNDSEERSDAFVYRVFDGVNYSADAVVTIIVNPVNDNAPFGVGSSVVVDEGAVVDVVAADGLLVGAGDDDVPAGTLSAVLVDAPQFGTVAVAADGSFSYTHDDSENHVDSFTFVVSDGELTSDPYPVEVTVTPVNDNTPSVDGLSFVDESVEGAVLSVAAVDGVLSVASDADLPGDTLTAELVTAADHGVVTVNADGSFTYAHDGSENHADSFTVAVRDGDWVSLPAAVVVSVTPVNDNAPEGGVDTYVTGAETDVFTADAASGVLFNDTDADVPADKLTAVLVTGPSLATAFTLNPDGSFSYDFDETGEVFEDSFTYQAFDGINTSAATTVNLTITPVNDNAPTAGDDGYTLDEGAALAVIELDGVLANDEDADLPVDYTLTATVATEPDFGTLTLAADGSFTYTHDGSENHADSFTYTTSDGANTSAAATVLLTINPVNDAPVAADATGTINENSDPGTPVATVGVTDPDNATHNFTITAGNDLGKFTIDASGAVTVVAGSNYEIEPTSYVLTVEASDAEPLSDTATVTITIDDVNEAPTLTVGTAYDVDENSATTSSIMERLRVLPMWTPAIRSPSRSAPEATLSPSTRRLAS